jgi:hypothetical protein
MVLAWRWTRLQAGIECLIPRLSDPVRWFEIPVRCYKAQNTIIIGNSISNKISHFQQSFPWPSRSPEIVPCGTFWRLENLASKPADYGQSRLAPVEVDG